MKTWPDTGRVIEAIGPLTQTGTVSPPGPLEMLGRALGGGPFGLQMGIEGGTGLNNIFLYAGIVGKVTQIDPDGEYFHLDDGSGARDGTQTDGVDNVGVMVQHLPMDFAVGDWVKAVGISVCFMDEISRIRPMLVATDISTVFPCGPAWTAGLRPSSDEPTHIGIYHAPVIGAESYRLYKSANGSDWELVASNNNPEGFDLTVTENTYFVVKAVGPGGAEGAPGERVYARVQDTVVRFAVTQPTSGQTGVSRSPSICWESVPGAVDMVVEAHKSGTDDIVWMAVVSPQDSATFGQRDRTLTLIPATSLLSPTTDYWLHVIALDSENWGFASCMDTPFTTGP
jgi:hypothetical protein